MSLPPFGDLPRRLPGKDSVARRESRLFQFGLPAGRNPIQSAGIAGEIDYTLNPVTIKRNQDYGVYRS